jgi:hypothetical protein
MEINPLVLAVVALLAGLAGITTNAIGINDVSAKDHPRARLYLIINLVISVLVAVGSVGYIGLHIKSGGAPSFRL